MFDKCRANKITQIYMEKYADLKELMEARDDEKRVTEELLSMDSLLNVYVEPTNRCNLRCLFCARENMKRDFDMLDFDTFKKVVDGLPAGTYLTVTGNGEPTLNVRIYDMISYAAQKGMFVSIITNGCTLNAKNRKRLIESGISRIQISFQALDKKEDEAIMEGVVFERELLNILKLIYEIRRSGKNIFITITKVDIEESRDSAEVTKKFWERMPIDNYYEGKYLSLQTDSKKYEKNTIYKGGYRPCADPWIEIKINANGDVNPCPQDFSNKYVIGNVNESSIQDILNSKEAKQFRRASLLGDMEFLDEIGYCCKDCNTWNEAEYNIEDFMKDTMLIRLGLVIHELGGERPANTEFLQKAIEALEAGETDLANTLMKEE